MTEKLLLCMDLDRTALPNGVQEESPQARARLRRVAARPGVAIAYVSGRRMELQQQAIRDYNLPEPDYAVADVGTSIYGVSGDQWRLLPEWHEEIGRAWEGRTTRDLRHLLSEMPGLALQEPEAQAAFKLSYFASSDLDHGAVIEGLRALLEPKGFRCSFIWSIDETTGTGLLDILPEKATKLHAVQFLMQHLGVNAEQTVYSGDSGNDLPVLTSGLQAVLVANAIPRVREEAVKAVQQRGCPEKLYVARGGFLGMNGNYAAGILEGLAHFKPASKAWMTSETQPSLPD